MSNRQYSGAYSRRRYSNYSAAAAKNAATGSATFGTASDNDDPQAMCTLRVSCIASMGRVTASGMQDGQVTVRKGSQVTLEATPRDGYRFVRWDIASRLPAGIDNTPPPAVRAKLETLITGCLDPIRRIYGRPIVVSSGYRSPALNAAVGGVANSQHTTGEAADLVPASGGSLAGIFRAAVQWGGYDQLIIERSGNSKWVHVSYGPRHRRKILAYNNGRYTDITNNWENYLNSNNIA